MFQTKYPIFQKGRILKIEMLEAMRELPLSFMKGSFSGYENGILHGFDCLIDEGKLMIQPGLLKVNEQILILDKEVEIPYSASDNQLILKIASPKATENQDMFLQEAVIELTDQKQLGKNEWELMRFKLKPGAYLRKEYQGFDDLITEYNTVNPIYQTISLYGQKAISPPMMQLFCDYLQEFNSQHPLDQNFCLQILQSHGIVGEKALYYYLYQRLQQEIDVSDAQHVHAQLNSILIEVKNNRYRKAVEVRKNRKLIVD
ncbi:hypothetical protein IW492_11420 [Enterococcus sp. BWB1-3]|uniref:hypothetical protein n=1 Tax=Enterococcus sp. BWB1-3 TaxID=2787713 RepID=UPI0019246BA0|nr:hypothetical protein [Enterococcus sp. BWB1-3]MBL1229841.1 hypothetical protein [Enterococcus sp. BWB1-3]